MLPGQVDTEISSTTAWPATFEAFWSGDGVGMTTELRGSL